jgi:hypothetical protein
MNWKNVTRRAIAPAVAVGLIGALGASASGCGDDVIPSPGDLCCESFKPGTNMVTVDWGLEGDANLKFGVFMQAIGDLSISAAGVIQAVGAECEAMVKEMGAEEPQLTPEQANDPAEHARQWCGVAFASIAEVKADARLTIEFDPPRCEVEASAQASCEASCQVDASCEPGAIEARCEGGELSGKCDAACEGTCEGSANVAVTCEGTCNGTCRGECSGGCEATDNQGNCAGSCEGTCEGKCEGSCEIDAGAEVECEGTCTGSCSVDFKAPKCSAEMTPPSCEADANCSGGCKASASAKAECHPPQLTIEAQGNVSAELEAKITTIRLHLPNLIAQLVGKVELVAGNVKAIADAGADVAASGELEVTAALCIVPAITAMEDATVNIQAGVDLAGELSASLE